MVSTDVEQIANYETALAKRTERLIDFYVYAELPIVCLGTLGHCLSLWTFWFSRTMRTPSFLFHKALTVSELLFCVNSIVLKALDYNFASPNLEYINYAAALYSSTVSRLISSSTGYVILYMTLLIAADRLLAVRFSARYRRIITRRVGLVSIAVTCVLAVCVNSWSAPIESVIQTMPGQNTTFYVARPRLAPPLYIALRDAKDVYNAVLRIAYLVLLASLTIIIIAGFIIRRRRLSRPCKRRMRRETILFQLLLLIVFLTFLQVVPAEAKRIISIIYPQRTLRATLADSTVDVATKLRTLNILYFGHIWAKLIANLCTFVNRSFNFYLYFCFNASFRHEVVRWVGCWRRRTAQEVETRTASPSFAYFS